MTTSCPADFAPIVAEIQAGGATSLRQIGAALNERGVPTVRGGAWASPQVLALLDRLRA